MAKKLLMNKVNNVIDNYNRWLQIFEFSKSFNTINDSRIDEEGRIYIDEIWGSTWQDSEDLSNIQHVGELYVDDNGKEQYKIEMESCNKNLINQPLVQGRWNIINGVFEPGFSGNVCCKELIKIQHNTTYQFYSSEGYKNVLFFDKNKKYIQRCPLGSNETELNNYNTPKNAEYVALTIDGTGITINTTVQLEQGTEATDYTPHDSHKQTILLPCQLMKVGNLKDRLFWDESKGKYIIEKNVGVKNINKNNLPPIQFLEPNRVEGYTVFPMGTDDLGIKYDWNTHVICNKFKEIKRGYNDRIAGEWICDNSVYTILQINNSSLDSLDREGLLSWLGDDIIEIYYQLQTPQLIETNITEPLYLPTYNNKTHAYITNTNNAKATIKAKFPVKTASAVANLNIENAKNSKDISDIKELNVNMLATNFDMDYRLLELEWALEDAGIAGINLLNTLNIDTKNNNKTLTRYEQAKIIITKQAYEYEILAKQLSRYLEKNIITQDEYDELIALMEENE